MGWGNCGEDHHGRPIGYNVQAGCDYENCDKEIDRGIYHVCGGEHGRAEIDTGDGIIIACGGYYCSFHMTLQSLCLECSFEVPSEDKNDNK